MAAEWEKIGDSLSKITIYSNPNNEPVTISGDTDGLHCIGIGTDAAVFQSPSAPAYAFKLFAEDKLYKIKIEQKIYKMIGDSPFFPTCFSAKDKYLVLSYEDGVTLFDCLLQGIHIPKQVIQDVEDARKYVRQKGLNPRDMHLKNILLQDNRAKIIDVTEYIQPGNDFRWEHLKEAYEEYYHIIAGKSVPFWLLDTIRKWYNKRDAYFSSYDDFVNFVLRFIPFKK
ncbi:serine/threonine protein kinase [Ornithinibacillus sp. L9]|uniref:Serine/threonine protein kinase n=1 Tax=Ornithinibacillus caprae TaxID=2678566 RepID=A0A6N8FJ14_9BACI|nr:serine/threonine protein kinase [Ornithinibacillus caprae]MUK89455.1 serine/threonine protein kinase [Ornithinibacillus caprae]